MADFLPILKKTFNLEGGYQNYSNDSANYNSKKQLVGTNHGISAIAYEQYIKRPPTVADMKAITKPIAAKVYEELFWKPLQGNLIKNDSLAHIMFDAFIASGYEGTKRIKIAINKYYGKKITPEVRTAITKSEIDSINKANPSKLFDIVKQGEIDNRNYLAKANTEKYGKFLKGWLNRLKQINYVDTLKKKEFISVSFILFLIGGVFYMVNKQKESPKK